MGTIFEGLQEMGRLKITTELRRFIAVDNNHEAVKICDLEKNMKAINVASPKSNKERSQYGRLTFCESD